MSKPPENSIMTEEWNVRQMGGKWWVFWVHAASPIGRGVTEREALADAHANLVRVTEKVAAAIRTTVT